MAASYPATVKTFPTLNPGDTIQDTDPEQAYDEIAAIEQALLNGLAHDLKFTDATYDIGKSGATRPRDLFLSRNLTVGGTITGAGLSLAIFAPRSVAGIAGGVTTFYGSVYDSLTETDVKFPVPVAGTIRNLYVNGDGTISGANTVIFTIRKNGSDQTVTCTVTGGAAAANDATHSFTVAAGDLISVKLVASASAETRKWCLTFQLAAA